MVIKIDLTTQQKAGDGDTVTVPATGKVGPSLNRKNLQDQIKGKLLDEAQAIVRRNNPAIKKVDIQTQLLYWISPWTDHITVVILPA